MHRYGVLGVILVSACGGTATGRLGEGPLLCEPTLPNPRFGYSAADAPIPPHFLASPLGTVAFADNTPADNPITNAGATLGRVLFHDTRLSRDDRIACASCHRQRFGFGDTARFSAGLNGRRQLRHTMALANARFNDGGRFFWDQRAASLEAQVLIPIADTLEMGMPLNQLEHKLAATPRYPALFAAAFGSPEINRDGIAKALAQFIRTLISSDARLDAAMRPSGAPDPTLLTREERQGLELFQSVGCANCHRSASQFADKASNIGLDRESGDTGVGGGRFRPPSLRNIGVRPPYMHDGRFKTLREVVEFYSERVRPDPGIDPRLLRPDGTPRRLALDSIQVSALVAFLETLTDTAFLRAERFGDPFPCHQINPTR
ncbi:MAG: cytochrome c peroxidase [Gemmatimonadota bacterium]